MLTMKKTNSSGLITRRAMLQFSAGTAAFGATASLPRILMASDASQSQVQEPQKEEAKLYADTLQTWCDGLLAHQLNDTQDPALRGAMICPACVLIHGRCGDAVYPLLRMAHSSGNEKYLHAALMVHEWSEVQVSRADGSWINDVTLSSWKGITVFHAIALAEALHHHGELLDAATRRQWTDRLARAAKFLDGFITIDTGNINYPVTSSLAFQLCGQVLGETRYLERAQQLARASLEHFTPSGLLFGEGHPQTGFSAKHCRPVDLGYNVEESLPALALYSVIAGDMAVLDQTIAALRTHMEFMLPDGGWDNSWGTRNYKWSWWGSRTSDGCHPAYVLLSQYDPKFREVARRNLELMAACTHNGLLYGGPDYFSHGDLPCIHHSFTHAKALATVLDRGSFDARSKERASLPVDVSYGLKSYPEIGTHLVSVGDWRATVTDYDWEYIETVQSGGGSAGGGHATGGALSLLYHRELGPVLVASMTEYKMIEISNQQAFRDAPHMALTPRVECVSGKTYTSLSDLKAELTATNTSGKVVFEARGNLLTASHQPVPGGGASYRIGYSLDESGVEITASAVSTAPLRFILPVVCRATENVEQSEAGTIRITKQKGILSVHTDAPEGFATVPKERTFNLVPGFECVPLTIAMSSGKEVRIRIQMSQKA
jgi:hypothetical protein